MKNNILLVWIVILFFAFSSCSKDSIIESVDNIDSISMLEKAKVKILSMGLDTTDIEEWGNFYVVEQDILINKDSLFISPMTRQYHTTYTVNNGQTITINVDNTITASSGWIEAIKEVISIYNEYTGLYLLYTESAAATITISKKAVGTNRTCAQGQFPFASGKPGTHLYINTQFYQNIDTYLTHNQKVFLMMHELGHNLGLRHTNCAVNGEGSGSSGMVKIPGTPDTDSNSYMNSATCRYSWTGMPEYDKIALAYLFPLLYTVHFENCTNVTDENFLKGQRYVLDRRIIPEKEGYSFAGWHHAPEGIYAPCRYDYIVTSNKTVYAHWTYASTDVVKYCSSHSYAGNSSSYKFSRVCPVCITIRVYKGENTWEEIKQFNDTYFEMSGSSLSDYKINMEPFMNVSETVPYVEYIDNIVLDEGLYTFQSKFTNKLGPQREIDGKHGYMITTIENYH